VRGQADQHFDTRQLPEVPDAVAPDGSDVRVLLRLGRGSTAHFELAPGRAGTHFQFRADAAGPLTAVGVTMPPWPGDTVVQVHAERWWACNQGRGRYGGR
jgi:hypothetical protein